MPSAAEPLGPVFGALADPTRRELLERLSREDDVSLTRLADGLPISRQAVAKHLRVLEDAGLVSSARAGRETRYTPSLDTMAGAAAWMARVGGEWDAR